MSEAKISEAAPAVYGIRVKGNLAIVGVLPVPLKDFPVKNAEWDDRYEEVPLYLHPQPAELAEQQGLDYAELVLSRYVKICIEEIPDDCYPPERSRQLRVEAMRRALAATGKQQVGEASYHPAQRQADIEGRIEPSARELEFLRDEQVGDDGLPLVCVTQEFKDQADYDAEISSAASNLLRNNTLDLSGSLPEMVAALLKLASEQQVGEVQGDAPDQSVIVPTLRAMVRNYSDGHRWDHLDARMCRAAADRIEMLEAALAARQPGVE